jgi:hypothetical protein
MSAFVFCVVISGQLTISNRTKESDRTRGQNTEKLIEAKSQQYQNRTDKFITTQFIFNNNILIKPRVKNDQNLCLK